MHTILEKTPRLIERQLANIRKLHCSQRSYAKKLHWAKAEKGKTNIDRALEHYDDFYASVFKNKWPSMRLALLCDPKYLAVPNVFTGDVQQISASLESLGGFNLERIWTTTNNKREKQVIDVVAETERFKSMDETLSKIARTKHAEEMEVLYQNAPKQKLESFVPGRDQVAEEEVGDSRIIKDVREASQDFIMDIRLKGTEEFLFESEYYSICAEPNATDDDSYQYTTKNTFTKLKFPPLLKPYTFEPGNPSIFPAAKVNSKSGLREFICVNGASLAPVIALDLKPDVTLLDLCSGPGTKSLLSLMTTCPSRTVCNDVDAGRLLRVRRLFKEFTGTDTPENVEYTRYNATNYIDTQFDRVLADVPCSQDRASCSVSDNNIFKTTRLKERLSLPTVQKQILLSAFRSLKPEQGSSCVYSTCTMSPIENDGAVGAALRETEIAGIHVDLIGLWNALYPLQKAGFFYMSRTKFGILIEPNVVSNFGPMYVSRLVLNPIDRGQLLQNHNSTSNNNNDHNNSSDTNRQNTTNIKELE